MKKKVKTETSTLMTRLYQAFIPPSAYFIRIDSNYISFITVIEEVIKGDK